MDLNRRDFIKVGALAGGGLLVSFVVPARSSAAHEKVPPAFFSPNAFLRIGDDDRIQITLSKVEMGQGIWTTLPMLLAEELDCDWRKITVAHSPAGKEYEEPVNGQGTGGSSTTWSEFDRYRTAGATARMMLVEAAARRLNVKTADCKTENGFVVAGKHSLRYGALAAEASTLPVPSVTLREPKDWKYIGKSQPRLDAPAKVNGTAQYGIDIHFPGMFTAVVARAPVFGGNVKSFDATAALAVDGVRDVAQIPGGIAVIADHFWAAKSGRDVLQIEWDASEIVKADDDVQREHYRRLSMTKGTVAQQRGSLDTGFSAAPRTIEAEYLFPYLAHAPMEPLNCVVRIAEGRCDVWTGSQNPLLFQSFVAKALGFQLEQVSIHTPFLGGSFGRRGAFDAHWVLEAVDVARISGKCIKLVWTREDDIRGGYYRPSYLHRAVIGVDSEGFPMAWHHRVVGQSLFINTPLEDWLISNGIDWSSVGGVSGSPYVESIPHHSIELHTTDEPVPVLPWRSVGNTHTCFVMETLVDELAFMAKKDPVEYRCTLLKNHPRHRAALDLAATKAEWNKPLPPGRFRGVAVHSAMESYVAQVVELSLENRKMKLHRVVCAIDCGLAVNPDGVRAQMEGCIIYGLTAALYGAITLKDGRVVQSNFHDYRMLRMNETPAIEVHIVPGDGKMGGVGEPGVPPVAAALANALFAATGKRVRALPVGL